MDEVQAVQTETLDRPALRIDVKHCPACDAPHRAVEAQTYKTKQPYTHWFLCPTLGDPVPLVMEIGEDVADVRPEIVEALVEARKLAKYCVVVFTPLADQPGEVLMRRFCHDFPTRCFSACVMVLKNEFDREIGPPPVEPLPKAGQIPPAVQLFSALNQYSP